MPKILFVYEYLGLGGVESVLATRLRTLKSLGVAAKAMFLADKGGKSLFHDLKEDIFVPSTPLEKFDYFSSFDPTLVVTIDTPSVVEIARSVCPQVPVVYEVHTTYEKELRFLESPRSQERIKLFIVPSASQESLLRRILRVSSLPVRIVPNAVDERFTAPPPSEPRSHIPLVCWVGRLDELKNWRGYLEVASRLAKLNASARFWLIGGLYSPLEKQDALWQSIVRSHLESRFHWFPMVLPEKMPEMLDKIQLSGGCVVSTSKNESFGMSILEAMARCCPVVVPAGGALAELTHNDEFGFTYPPNIYDQAAACIEKIILDPQLGQIIAEKGRQQALRFNAADTTRSFLDAIAELEYSG